jgi:hypothetical protein
MNNAIIRDDESAFKFVAPTSRSRIARGFVRGEIQGARRSGATWGLHGDLAANFGVERRCRSVSILRTYGHIWWC